MADVTNTQGDTSFCQYSRRITVPHDMRSIRTHSCSGEEKSAFPSVEEGVRD